MRSPSSYSDPTHTQAPSLASDQVHPPHATVKNVQEVYAKDEKPHQDHLKKHQTIYRVSYELVKAIGNCEQCLVLSEEDWKISDDTLVKPDVSVHAF